MTQLLHVTNLTQALAGKGGFDAVVLVAHDPLGVHATGFVEPIAAAARLDSRLASSNSLVPAAQLAGGRLVISGTGPLLRDQDDVRRYADAAHHGVRRARDAGARKPLVVCAAPPADARYAEAVEVTALAAVGALWEPLEAREALGERVAEPIAALGFAALAGTFGKTDAQRVDALESALRLARDLCGTEPERMSAPRFAEYLKQAFLGLPVKVSVVDAPATLLREYPLLAAVARASMGVERHRPRVVRLEYAAKGAIRHNWLIAGKGLTYDTGGADLKAGGVMAGMSRDKGGAAAAAGLVLAAARLELPGVRIVAELGLVRNSIGSDAFVSDEIITSHAGLRVRIGNTDAEGRLVLADLLSHLRERAVKLEHAHLFTLATLTGHAGRAVGPYTIAMDNGPARQRLFAEQLARQGDQWGDPVEVSRLRREDFDFVAPRSKADQVLSCNNLPSSGTPRGHQFPMAFLAIASGLDQHGADSKSPLCFTHIDIGGSGAEGGDWQHGRPTARPVVALLHQLLEG